MRAKLVSLCARNYQYDVKILMQLFMILYSGRNVVVHPCKSFLTGSAMGCGESDKFKNAFFQLNFSIFEQHCAVNKRPAGDALPSR